MFELLSWEPGAFWGLTLHRFFGHTKRLSTLLVPFITSNKVQAEKGAFLWYLFPTLDIINRKYWAQSRKLWASSTCESFPFRKRTFVFREKCDKSTRIRDQCRVDFVVPLFWLTVVFVFLGECIKNQENTPTTRGGGTPQTQNTTT